MEVVAAWLEEHGLSDYAANFDEEGYDDMQLLAELSAEETAELGEAVQMKKGHRIKLAKRLAVVQGGGGGGEPRADTAAQLAELQATIPELCTTVERQGGHIAELQASVVKLTARLAAGGGASSLPRAGAGAKAGGVKKGFFGGEATTKKKAAPKPAKPAAPEGGGGSVEAGAAAAAGAVALHHALHSPTRLVGQGEVAAEAAAEAGGGAGGSAGGSAGDAGAAAAGARRDDESMHDGPDVPEVFKCSITKELFCCPVITSDGHSYERDAIKQWLELHGTSPLTGQPLPDKVLRPNHSLRAQIVEFRERRALPALPPWSPDPQETVPTRAPEPEAGALGAVDPAALGQFMLPGMPGGGGVRVETQQLAQAVANLLVNTPDLVQQIVDSGVPEAAHNPGAAINAVLQNPQLLQTLMAHPLAQQHFWPLVPQAAMLAGPGVLLPGEPPLFQAAREGEVPISYSLRDVYRVRR